MLGHHLRSITSNTNEIFTITAEIHARSLANFYGQYADRHEFEVHATRQRARAGNSTICYRKKRIDVTEFLIRLTCY